MGSMLSEALRRDHGELCEHVTQLAAVARELPDLAPAERDLVLERVRAVLGARFLQHLEQEERTFASRAPEQLPAALVGASLRHDLDAIRVRAAAFETTRTPTSPRCRSSSTACRRSSRRTSRRRPRSICR